MAILLYIILQGAMQWGERDIGQHVQTVNFKEPSPQHMTILNLKKGVKERKMSTI